MSKVIHNSRVVDSAKAVFSLTESDLIHGYGCYETLKVRGGVLFYPEFHAERLIRSADIIGFKHTLTVENIVEALVLLIRTEQKADCNIKIMVFGHIDREADWYILCYPALYPPEGSYAKGVACMAFHGERQFPQAKTLSLLLSTIAFKQAEAGGCWDALLVNRQGEITEGTRTNVFYALTAEPEQVYTPPAGDVLAGITRKTCMDAMENAGRPVRERPLLYADVVAGSVGLLVSSTSSRLLPVSRLYTGPKDREGRTMAVMDILTSCTSLYEAAQKNYAAGRPHLV